MFNTLNPKALIVAAAATLLLIISIFIGSRNLGNFDPALVAYLFACIFACFGVVYRYTVWLQRPPTWRFFQRSFEILFSRRIITYTLELVKHFLVQMVGQRFIRKRGKAVGRGHLLMAAGSMLGFAVTFPLVFGWIHFGLKPGGIDTYEIYTFGFKTAEFPIHSIVATLIFNALNWASLMVIPGVMLLMHRRFTHAGLIATQTFESDWLPLILLLAIALTGLGISLDYKFMEGRAHQFMAITHAMTVIMFLIWMPFGKFFHIIQRPAQLGIAIYLKAGKEGVQATCPHTQEAFTSKMQVDDLKVVTEELGFDFTREDGSSHLDFSPKGKRALISKAQFKAREESGSFFG